ncbi:hypothetical protein J2793_006705 [Paraburkholderia caledonica]|uniref:Uncharacterized protein n=1 Tax=Paraburkholderia caledonica TaxID=134536 RepID=A0AB73IMT0_9BURK|nr:hypothetical protein [Paraburkholderia caledonica]
MQRATIPTSSARLYCNTPAVTLAVEAGVDAATLTPVCRAKLFEQGCTDCVGTVPCTKTFAPVRTQSYWGS